MPALKPRYLVSSTVKTLTARGFRCPSCGACGSEAVSRKYWVTTLRRCRACRLLYRAPTSTARASHRHYNGAYRSGLTTEMPDEAALEELKRRGFAGTPKCFDRYIAVLRALGFARGARVLDYGCSWGYGAWQMQRAGYEAVGFEVSAARAAFARERMDVDTVTEAAAVRGRFDVVFSAHVLEHVPSVAGTVDRMLGLLAPAGMLVAVTPNGSAEFRAGDHERWNRLWGQVHPNFLDAEYYEAAFSGRAYLLTSRLDRLDRIAAWAAAPRPQRGELGGWELLAVAAN